MKSYLWAIICVGLFSVYACNDSSTNTKEEVKEELASEDINLIDNETTIQELNPVKWDYASEKISDNQYRLIFTAQIDDHWYVYSNSIKDDGPIPTTINFEEGADVIESKEDVIESGEIIKDGYDELFEMDIKKFGKSATFTQIITVKNPVTLSGYLEYMTCDSIQCLFPEPIEFTLEAN